MLLVDKRQNLNIPRYELDAILYLFLLKFGDEYDQSNRHAVLVGPPFDRNYSTLRDREFTNLRQQLEAKARELRIQGYGKRKNKTNMTDQLTHE